MSACVACGGGRVVASWDGGPIWVECPHCAPPVRVASTAEVMAVVDRLADENAELLRRLA